MELKKYTWEMFDELPVVNHIKQCPSGDYSKIEDFLNCCSFDNNCKFENWANFEQRCDFGQKCEFGDYCNFANHSTFKDYCIFGKGCIFGSNCNFGIHCICEFGEFTNMVSYGGLDGYERITCFFLLNNGEIFVRGGCCFSGSIDEWELQIKKSHTETVYLSSIQKAKAQLKMNS